MTITTNTTCKRQNAVVLAIALTPGSKIVRPIRYCSHCGFEVVHVKGETVQHTHDRVFTSDLVAAA